MSHKDLAKQSRQAYTDLQSKNPMGFFYFPMENRKDVVSFLRQGSDRSHREGKRGVTAPIILSHG